MKKIIIFVFILLSICLLGNVQNVLADEGAAYTKAEMWEQTDAFVGATGFEESATVGSITSTFIKTFLGLLGIIFIILIVYAGYIWMMAQGNEEDIEKAKKIIRNSIIGLIIIIAAYSITYFVFSSLAEINGGGITADTG